MTTIDGCDSIHSTALTVNPTYSISDPAVTICNGDSTLIYGTFRTAADTYYDSLATVNGCDSIHSTVLTVNPTYSTNTPDETICDGDSVMIFAIYRNTAGTYYDTLTAMNGCDSVVVTTLLINNLPSLSLIVADVSCYGACDGSATITATGGNPPYTYQWGPTYPTCQSLDCTIMCGGTDTVTVTDSTGCASSIAVTINEPPLTQSSSSATICDNDSIFLQGAYQNTPGTYFDTFTAVNGCDSIHSTALTVNPAYSISTADETICNGDSVMIFGTYRTAAGTYYDSLTTDNGCDSIVATTLIVNPLPAKPAINQSGNDLASSTADFYQWYYYDTLIVGATSQFHTPTKSGFYSVMVTDANGCTSTSDPFSVTISSIENIEYISSLNVYPNPNTGEFIIEMNITQTENFELKIFNILGQEIFTEELKQFKGIYKKQLDLKKYPVGIYNLQLITDKGVINKQVIIE